MAASRPTVFVYVDQPWKLPIKLYPKVYLDGDGSMLLLVCGKLEPSSPEVQAFLAEWRYAGLGGWVEATIEGGALTRRT